MSFLYPDNQLKQHSGQEWVHVRNPEPRALSPEQQASQERARHQDCHNPGTPRKAPVVPYSGGLQTQLDNTKAELLVSQTTVEELKGTNKVSKSSIDYLTNLNEEYKTKAQKLQREKDDLLYR